MGLLKDIKDGITPTSIEALKATIVKHGGLAKQNRFAVIVTPPTNTLLNLDLQNVARSALSGTFSLGNLLNDPRDVGMLCETAMLPGHQIQTIEYGSMQNWFNSKIPTGYFGEDVLLSFHVTTDFWIRKFFDRWAEAVISKSEHTVAYEADYTSDVIIQQLDENNVPTYGVKLIKAFPTTIAGMPLDNTADITHRVQVTLAYEDFETLGSIQSMVAGIRENVTGSLRRLI